MIHTLTIMKDYYKFDMDNNLSIILASTIEDSLYLRNIVESGPEKVRVIIYFGRFSWEGSITLSTEIDYTEGVHFERVENCGDIYFDNY